MINIFSIEIFLGLLLGILVGWSLKNIFSKTENVNNLAENLKSLEEKIESFQNSNATERGSLKVILQDIKSGEADVVKAAEDIKRTLLTGGSQSQGSWGELVLTRILTENLKMNNFMDRTEIFPIAISDKAGNIEFWQSDKSNLSSVQKTKHSTKRSRII